MNIFLGPPHPEVVCMQDSLRSSSTVTHRVCSEGVPCSSCLMRSPGVVGLGL